MRSVLADPIGLVWNRTETRLRMPPRLVAVVVVFVLVGQLIGGLFALLSDQYLRGLFAVVFGEPDLGVAIRTASDCSGRSRQLVTGMFSTIYSPIAVRPSADGSVVLGDGTANRLEKTYKRPCRFSARAPELSAPGRDCTAVGRLPCRGSHRKKAGKRRIGTGNCRREQELEKEEAAEERHEEHVEEKA